MDHEPQWESLANEEQQLVDNETRKSSTDTNNAETDEEDGETEALQKPVRSLKDSAPLSSCSEVTLNKLETVGLLQAYEHDNNSETYDV